MNKENETVTSRGCITDLKAMTKLNPTIYQCHKSIPNQPLSKVILLQIQTNQVILESTQTQ